MFCGVKEFALAPAQGLLMMGYARPPRPNQGEHDPLMGCCVYLETEDTKAAIVTLDLLQMSREICARIQEECEKKTGIPGDAILICPSHTHSGPRAYGDSNEQEIAFQDQLTEKVIAAVEAAQRERFRGRVSVTQGICGSRENIGGNRDVPGGVCDPRVGVLSVWDETNALRGMLVNYTLHPTLLREANLLCSADYPGYIRKSVQEACPACAFGFMQGASGDQSSRYYREKEGYEEAERFGRAIAKVALSTLKNAEKMDSPLMRVSVDMFPVRLRQFPPAEKLKKDIEEKTAIYQHLLETEGGMTAHNAKLAMYGAECKLQYSEAMEAHRSEYERIRCKVFALRIDQYCIVGIMGECFVEYGLAIKALSGAEITLVATITNGTLPGYVCTPAAYREGGYEPDASMLHEGFGAVMAQKAVANARSLFD